MIYGTPGLSPEELIAFWQGVAGQPLDVSMAGYRPDEVAEYEIINSDDIKLIEEARNDDR